jgi:type IV secretory pathway VirJ component
VAPYLEPLRAKSARRIATDADFVALTADIARLEQRVESKSVVLNEAERRQELAEAKARRSERAKDSTRVQAEQPTTYDVTLKNASSPRLSRSVPAKRPPRAASSDATNEDPAPPGFAEDLLLNEGLNVLADYTELLRGPSATPAPGPAQR